MDLLKSNSKKLSSTTTIQGLRSFKSKSKMFGSLKQTTIIKNKIDMLQDQAQNEADLFDKLVKIFEKKVKPVGEIYFIASYLNSLKEFVTYIKSHNENYQDLLIQVSSYLRSLSMKKNKIVFRYGIQIFKQGDKGGVFFIILSGSVSIIKPREIKMEITEEEYLLFLVTCKKYEENEIIRQVLIMNSGLFDLEEELIHWLKSSDSIMSPKLAHKFYNRVDHYKELADFWFDNSGESTELTSDHYVKRIEVCSSKSKKSYTRSVTLLQYEKITILKAGYKFGEISIEKTNMRRTATVFCEEDCFFGTLDKASYDSCLKEVNEKQIKKSLDFFLSCKLFFGFNKKLFENRLLHSFVLKKVDRFEKLFNEGEVPKFIYIVKKGEFEISTRLSLKDFEDIIKTHRDVKLLTKMEEFKEKERIESR